MLKRLFSAFSAGDKKDTAAISLESLLANISPTAGEADLTQAFDDPNSLFLSNLDDEELVTIIDEMMMDDQVFSEFETLKSHILNPQWDIQPPAEFAEDSTAIEMSAGMKTALTKRGGRLYHELSKMLDAIAYGSSFGHVIWKDPAENFGIWEIDEIVMLDRSRYGFNHAGQLIFLDSSEVLEDPYKYITMSHGVTKGNPFGNSAVLKAYWPWKFRKECIKSGILYAKKSIIPSLIALYQASADHAENTERAEFIAAQLRALANSAGAAMANVDSVEKIEASSKGTDIIDLVEMFNRMISKAILGVSTLTNDTRYSNRGDTTSQEELIKARASKIQAIEFEPVVNQVLSWGLELNNPSVDKQKEPYFFYSDAYTPTFEEVTTLINSGVTKISRNWLFDKFSIVESEGEEDDIKPAESFAFSAKSETPRVMSVERENFAGQIDFFQPSGRRVTGLERLTEIMTIFSGRTQDDSSRIFGKS